MERKMIDLSVPMEKNDGEIAEYILKQTNHKEGGDIFGRKITFPEKGTLKQYAVSVFNYIVGRRKITGKSFPDGEFLNLDIITASVHTGTHFDAPLHFGPKCEGEPSMSVDEIPIEWCFSDGVVLDMTFKKPGEYILPEDVEQELKRINYGLKPYDIVLIRTGGDRYWGRKEYLFKYPGMSKEATSYLVDKGIKVIGIDSYGFDRPFINMINDYFKTLDNKYLFPAHFFGREKCYCHIERLANLDKLPRPYGFKVSCLPVKIRGAGAAWTRVVAIL